MGKGRTNRISGDRRNVVATDRGSCQIWTRRRCANVSVSMEPLPTKLAERLRTEWLRGRSIQRREFR